MVMDPHNALLSRMLRTCRATIHANHKVIFIYGVYQVLFGMIEYLISIKFPACIIHNNHCASVNENPSITH